MKKHSNKCCKCGGVVEWGKHLVLKNMGCEKCYVPIPNNLRKHRARVDDYSNTESEFISTIIKSGSL